jgi:hypothetical protein
VGLFVDGETTIELHTTLYEAKTKPEFYKGINFSGPHRTLWQETFRVTASRDELLALTPNEEEQVDYRTCLVPHTVRLEGDRKLSFRKGDVSPQELQLKKGNAIGYSVLVNKKNVGCYKDYPRSPLTRLPKHPTCDSPAEIMLRIFQYEPGHFRGKDDRQCGSSQTLWLATRTVDSDSGAFDLQASDDFGPRRWGWRRWRECRVPKDLELTTDGRIVFDSTNLQVIGFTLWSDQLPLVRITVDDGPPKLVSTQLCNPIAVWHPTHEDDDSVKVTIDVTVTEPPNVPDAKSPRAVWSRSYWLSSQVTGASPTGGDAK